VILKSAYPDVPIPDVALTELVLGPSRARGEGPAVVDAETGHSVSYRELGKLVDGVAQGLQARGVRKGDVVALLLPNTPLFPAVFHGALRAGAVVTPVNTAYRRAELEHQLQDSGARLLIASSAAGATVDGLGIDVEQLDVEAAPAAALAQLLEPGAVAAPPIDAATDVAVLPYSSGTTGLPKGVMLTHRNLAANLTQLGALQHVGEDEVVAAVLPFFHIYGMQTIMNQALLRGATLVTMTRFRLAPFVEAVARHRITRIYAVPPMIVAFAKHPDLDAVTFSSVRQLLSAAAPLDPAIVRACEARTGCRVKQGYGLTETSPVTHIAPDDGDIDPASVGYTLPNTECKIVDAVTRETLGVGETGELCVRGPQVMSGYLHRPDATAATIDADGFLHTGDLARIDERGECFIVDRLKELIKVRGFQVAPAELEAVLLTHDAVADAAVVGHIDANGEEVPKAFVVLGRDIEPDAIRRFVADRVATYKQLAAIEVVDEIPRSPSGKILRRVLRDRDRTPA
jgi:acyl-CoA synthetase (AMP-forming)/AMP-acid ligase II